MALQSLRRLRWHLIVLLGTLPAHADPIPVKYPQGSDHAFVSLKTLDGVTIATGEILQTVRGDRVTSRLFFRFKDGSIDEDVTVFTQKRFFRLISDHHIQRGKSFPEPIDCLIDGVTGQITNHDLNGKISVEHIDLPADISNGLPPNLIVNLDPATPETKISFLVPGKKPRLVHISIKPTATQLITVGSLRRKATDFTLHVEIGGVAGLVAPIIGKQPADYHIWLLDGTPPAFIREEGPLYDEGPIWRMEEISPVFPR